MLGNVFTSVCQEFCPGGGYMDASHACSPLPCMPPTHAPNTHAPCHAHPLPHMPPCHICPPPATHTPLPHIPLPCMPPLPHVSPPPHMPPPPILRVAVNERAVRILLEWILVGNASSERSRNSSRLIRLINLRCE